MSASKFRFVDTIPAWLLVVVAWLMFKSCSG